MYEIFEDTTKIYIVMEYVQGINLLQYLENENPIKIDKITNIFRSIVKALH